MYVLVTGRSAEVHEPDDFRRLHLSAPGLGQPQISAALDRSGLGTLVDAETAQLDVAALRAVVAESVSISDWESQWDAMISYAETRGWLSEGGTVVQVHLQ